MTDGPRAQDGQLLVDVSAHAHQPQWIPLGVAGPCQLLKMGEKSVLQVRIHRRWVRCRLRRALQRFGG